MDNVLEKIERLEYHQRLLMGMISGEGHEFDQLIIKKNLDEKEVQEFHDLCEQLSIEVEKEKAEQFVFHAPLFIEFLYKLNPKLNAEEVINACLMQKIHLDLMKILHSNLK